jgi:hypothetical protein
VSYQIQSPRYILSVRQFLGARASLKDQIRIDTTLEAGQDLEALLKPQENYRDFQKSYLNEPVRTRTWTDDGLSIERLLLDVEKHIDKSTIQS